MTVSLHPLELKMESIKTDTRYIVIVSPAKKGVFNSTPQLDFLVGDGVRYGLMLVQKLRRSSFQRELRQFRERQGRFL
jgi:hypothetical protein